MNIGESQMQIIGILFVSKLKSELNLAFISS